MPVARARVQPRLRVGIEGMEDGAARVHRARRADGAHGLLGLLVVVAEVVAAGYVRLSRRGVGLIEAIVRLNRSPPPLRQ